MMSGGPEPAPWAIRVEHVTVRPDRVVADVRVSEERFCSSSQAIADMLAKAHPHLLSHSCVNEEGEGFSAVAASTSTPHVLEHLAIDMQAARCSAPGGTTFLGSTRWVNRAARLARIELSFADDLAALASLRDAASELDAVLRAAAS